MQTPTSTPFADVISSLAVLNQEQHQALLDIWSDQEHHFKAIIQAQQEDHKTFWRWMDREVRAETAARQTPPTHLPLTKMGVEMGVEDEPEAFVDLFEKTAETSGWPREQWPVRLIPLLSGKAQVAAPQLTVQNLLVFDDLKRAILQRVGRSPEQHRQRFRSLVLGESGRPFVMAQQLRGSCRKWLLAEGSNVEHIIDRVVLEQFIIVCQGRRQSGSSATDQRRWTQPGSDGGVPQGWRIPSSCLSLSSPLFYPSPTPSIARPVPLPRSRPPGHPRGRGGTGPVYAAGPKAPPWGAGQTTAGTDNSSVSPLSPRHSRDPLSATRAAGRSGSACWRCGDPEHFIDRCPMMEVGTMIQVPDGPQAAPGQAGWYQIPVSIKGGTYQALVDSGCNQTSIL